MFNWELFPQQNSTSWNHNEMICVKCQWRWQRPAGGQFSGTGLWGVGWRRRVEEPTQEEIIFSARRLITAVTHERATVVRSQVAMFCSARFSWWASQSEMGAEKVIVRPSRVCSSLWESFQAEPTPHRARSNWNMINGMLVSLGMLHWFPVKVTLWRLAKYFSRVLLQLCLFADFSVLVKLVFKWLIIVL